MEEKLKEINAKLDNMSMNDDELLFAETKQEKKAKIPPIIDGISPAWWSILTPDTKTSEILQTTLNSISKANIKPIHRDVFNFARFTPPDNIKVVILGQDPYDTVTHAHGLAFSSQHVDTPKSLGNIFKALKHSKIITDYPPKTNSLLNWAAQGVLLLNTALTVLSDQPESHLKLWQPYMNILLRNISASALAKNTRLVVILWGKKAQAYADHFSDHHILTYKHPSPMAGDFTECPNFTDCNNILARSGSSPINWNPDFNAFVELYTDGSSYPNLTGPDVQSGYSVIFTRGALAPLKLCGKTINEAPHYSNNIRAEGTALLKALGRVYKLPLENRRVLHIVTDCEFWITMLREYIPKWMEIGESYVDTHKNPDLVKAIWKLYCDIQEDTFITISHVYSHDKKVGSKTPKHGTEYKRFFYNKLADSLANYSRQKFSHGQEGEFIQPMEYNGEKF